MNFGMWFFSNRARNVTRLFLRNPWVWSGLATDLNFGRCDGPLPGILRLLRCGPMRSHTKNFFWLRGLLCRAQENMFSSVRLVKRKLSIWMRLDLGRMPQRNYVLPFVKNGRK